MSDLLPTGLEEIALELSLIDWPDYGVFGDPAIWDPESDSYDPVPEEDVRMIEYLRDRYAAGLDVDPITVKRCASGSYAYALDDGWHRIQAAVLLGWASLPAVILP